MRREKKIGDVDKYARLIWDVFRGQKMGEGLYETEVQRMVRNTDIK